MYDWLIEVVGSFGYLGVLLLICVESVFPPIPSEVVLIFGGVMTTQTNMNMWIVILYATIGSTLGAIILYLLGRLLSKDRLKKIFSSRLGRFLRLKEEDVDKAEKWFSKYEYKAVFICRCVPIVRSLISVPAGMAKMKVLPFLTLTILGSAIWNTVLVWVGKSAGDAWEYSLQYMGWYSKVVVVIFIVVAIVAAVKIYKRSKIK